MSTSPKDAFIDSFLDRVLATGDVKLASAAIDLFMKEAASTGFETALKNTPGAAAGPTSSFGERPVQAPVNFGTSGFKLPAPPPAANPLPRPYGSTQYRSLPLSNDVKVQNAGVPAPAAPAVTSNFGGAFSGMPPSGAGGSLPAIAKPPAPAPRPAWAPFYRKPGKSGLLENPQAQLRLAAQDYMARTGATPQAAFSQLTGLPSGGKIDFNAITPPAARIHSYANEGAVAQAKADLADEQAQLQRASQISRDNDPAVATTLQIAGKARDTLANYPQALAAKQKAEADAKARFGAKFQGAVGDVKGLAGKARDMVSSGVRSGVGSLKSLVSGAKQVASGVPGELADKQQLEATQSDAVRREFELQRQLDERAAQMDQQERMNRYALKDSYDTKANEGIANLRKELAGLDKQVETGFIPEFKNLRNTRLSDGSTPQVHAPSAGATPEALARRESIAAEIAKLEGSRFMKPAPAATDASGMAAEKANILAYLDRRKAAVAPSPAYTAASADTAKKVEAVRAVDNATRFSNYNKQVAANTPAKVVPAPRIPL